MSIDVNISESDQAALTVSSALGHHVTFDVRYRTVPIGHSAWGGRATAKRYVVGLKGSDGEGFSHHTTFDIAFKAALSRARRYEKALHRLEVRKGVAA